MGQRLIGRVAIVTGGGRGIGRTVALQMAEEGAAVVIADLGVNLDGSGKEAGPADETVQMIKAMGGRAIAHYGDVANFADTKDLVDTTLREFGRLDILTHVAGILRDRMVFNMTEDDWDAVLAVHLKGAFNTVRNALEPMMRQRYGRILLFSSRSSLGASGQANYAAAKAAQVGMARSLANELAPFGITINAIYPSANTRMRGSIPESAAQLRASAGIVSGSAAGRGKAAPDAGPVLRDDAPPGQSQEDPENNAPTSTWLATEAASGVTGQVIGTWGWQASRYTARYVTKSIRKSKVWTVDELAVAIPRLTVDSPNPAPKAPPRE